MASLLAAVAFAATFLAAQAKGAHPLLPPLRSRTVTVCLVVGFTLNAAYYEGVFSLYL